MKVELSAEARAQVQRIDAWWRANRRAAPNLFTDELEQALLALEKTPALGLRYAPKPNVRRLLLMRSHYHLYVALEPTRVYVVAVWSAYRGHGLRPSASPSVLRSRSWSSPAPPATPLS